MKRLLGLLLVMGMVGCGDPVAELRSFGAKITKDEQGKVIKVDLSSTLITDAGLMHVKGLTNLQKLDLRATKVTPLGVAELLRVLPNCTIDCAALSFWESLAATEEKPAMAWGAPADLTLLVTKKIAGAGKKVAAARENTRLRSQIAQTLASAGRFKQAIQVAQELEDKSQQTVALSEIAKLLAKSGQFEHSMQVAQGITSADEKAAALRDISSVLVASGEFTKAMATALTINYVYVRVETLTNLASELTKKGDKAYAHSALNQAIRVLQKNKFPPRAPALTNLAVALVTVGKPKLCWTAKSAMLDFAQDVGIRRKWWHRALF